jgi:hypothetical protein
MDISEIAGFVVRHKCDNRICVNPDHLELGTFGDNNRDTVARGRWRSPVGSKHHFSKLSEDQVYEIRRRLANKETSKQICGTFGVTPSLIDQIRQNKIWKHVQL